MRKTIVNPMSYIKKDGLKNEMIKRRGKMDLGENGMGEQLIIASDKDNLECSFLYLIITVGGSLFISWMIRSIYDVYVIHGRTKDDYIALILFEVAFGCFLFIMVRETLGTWIGTNRVLVMDESGCTVRFHQYQKHYQWDELAVKRYEKGKYRLDFDWMRLGSSYYEGIFFSKYQSKKLRWMKPYDYCIHFRPLSSFYVNFYPLGISKGHGDYESQMNAFKVYTKGIHQKGEKMPDITRKPEVYPVDKDEFLNYMILWHVEIEGLSEMDKMLYKEDR